MRIRNRVLIARGRLLRVLEADVTEFFSRTEKLFDLVCAFDIIEHFQKDEILALLDLFGARLSPGGLLIIQMPNAGSPWASQYQCGDFNHELILDSGSVTSILRLTGFHSIKVQEGCFNCPLSSESVKVNTVKAILQVCVPWNLAETVGLYGNVYTRNMIVKAVKGDRVP